MGSKNLEGLGDYDGVDFFGLDDFGQPAGLNPMWGGMLGALAQTGGAIAARKFGAGGRFAQYSELVGAGLGLLAGAAMWAFPGSRAAGMTTAAVAAVSGGLRQMEISMLSGSMGWPSIDPAYPVSMNGLGIHSIEPGYSVNQGSMNGLGAQTQLLGQDRQTQLLGMGGPQVSGLAGAYGATLFGN
jgi:hypothetical protein